MIDGGALLLFGGLYLLRKVGDSSRVTNQYDDPPAPDWVTDDSGAPVEDSSGAPVSSGASLPGDDMTTGNPGRAFLWTVGVSETSLAAMRNGDAFHTFYRGALFSDLSDHPVITGEMQGIRLPDDLCIKAGFAPGCVSTAAGAFQINKPTWLTVRSAGAWGPRLPDFSEASQWEAARRVAILAGAWGPAAAGDFAGAVAAGSKRWASLPGSTSGQHQNSFARLSAIYTQALATLA